MSKASAPSAFRPGFVTPAALTVLEVLGADKLFATRYRVRYACCQGEGVISHEGLVRRTRAGALALADGRAIPLCQACTRHAARKQATERRWADKVLPRWGYWPLVDARLGRISPPPTADWWPVPESARQKS